MLKSIIKITCTIDKNKRGGRDNGLLESTELVAEAETSSKGECGQAVLMGTSQDALRRERRVSTCESVNGDWWGELPRKHYTGASPQHKAVNYLFSRVGLRN